MLRSYITKTNDERRLDTYAEKYIIKKGTGTD